MLSALPPSSEGFGQPCDYDAIGRDTRGCCHMKESPVLVGTVHSLRRSMVASISTRFADDVSTDAPSARSSPQPPDSVDSRRTSIWNESDDDAKDAGMYQSAGQPSMSVLRSTGVDHVPADGGSNEACEGMVGPVSASSCSGGTEVGGNEDYEVPSRIFLEALQRARALRRKATAPMTPQPLPAPPTGPPPRARPRSAMASLAGAAIVGAARDSEHGSTSAEHGSRLTTLPERTPQRFMDPLVERSHFLRAVQLMREKVTAADMVCVNTPPAGDSGAVTLEPGCSPPRPRSAAARRVATDASEALAKRPEATSGRKLSSPLPPQADEEFEALEAWQDE